MENELPEAHVLFDPQTYPEPSALTSAQWESSRAHPYAAFGTGLQGKHLQCWLLS